MRKFLLGTIISSGLILGGLAFAAGPYSLDIDTTERRIYFYPSAAVPSGGDPDTLRNYPPSTTLTAKVVDQAGKPVAGVPVTFGVAQDSMLKDIVQFAPQQATTGADGTVQTTVSPTPSATTGAGKVTIQAGNVTETVMLHVQPSTYRARN